MNKNNIVDLDKIRIAKNVLSDITELLSLLHSFKYDLSKFKNFIDVQLIMNKIEDAETMLLIHQTTYTNILNGVKNNDQK